jgi:hypothetical protein
METLTLKAENFSETIWMYYCELVNAPYTTEEIVISFDKSKVETN